MRDYFGFCETDNELPAVDEDQLLKKIDEIRHDLKHVVGVICEPTTTTTTTTTGRQQDDSETVPKALVALKFRIPMVFICKLAEYFAHHSNKKSQLRDINQSGDISSSNSTSVVVIEEPKNAEATSNRLTNSNLLKKLIELRQKLWEHRLDLKRLNEIVKETSPIDDHLTLQSDKNNEMENTEETTAIAVTKSPSSLTIIN